MVERIDNQYVGFQPQSHELLAALALYLTSPESTFRVPRDEQELAKGLLAAVKEVPSLGLGRFVDIETGQLTDQARTSLLKLQEGKVLAVEGESFIVPEGMRDKLKSQTRTYFKDPGIEALKQAAAAAGSVWLPQ